MKRTVEFQTSGGRLEVETGNGQTLFSVVEADGACYRAYMPFELSKRASIRVESNRFNAKVAVKCRGLKVYLGIDFEAPCLGTATRVLYATRREHVSLRETSNMPSGNVVFVTTLDGIVLTLLEKNEKGHTVVLQKDDKVYTAFIKTPYDLAENVAFRQGLEERAALFVIELPIEGSIKERSAFFDVDLVDMKLEFTCVLHAELV